ncbi:MAG: phosphomannomutase/phosphoglucomutase [Legionellales bacterium]|nr:phosphomannomutase/phosphoglucomutase [Legionellales bacterium]
MEDTGFSIDRSIFRAYDIRGVVGQTLTPATVWAVGAAFGSSAIEENCHTVVLARDGRLSSEDLLSALKAGIISTGCDVVDIGCVPTPVLYYATEHFKTGTGVMVTGSHNPPEYNGLKMMLAGKCLAQSQIQALYERICQRNFQTGLGNARVADISEDYVRQAVETVSIEKPLTVVVDAGNGVAGPLACDTMIKLGMSVIPLYCDIDGTFPNHHPNPSDTDSLKDLISVVQQRQADIGLAFDGDGDRLGVVTHEGQVIWPDQLLGIFAQSLLERKPGSTIVFDVKCSKQLAQTIEASGGVPLMSKTGHSLIKGTMKEHQSPLAGEMSGHFFFAENWFGFDDGILAAVRLMEILSKQSDLKSFWANIPQTVATPEINVALPDEIKFEWMEAFKNSAEFPGGKKITIDGLRVEWPDGWGLVRVSNTTPCLVLRFEADSESALERIKNVFKAQMSKVKLGEAIKADF